MKRVIFNRIGALAFSAMTLILAGCSFAPKNVEEQVLNDISDTMVYSEIAHMSYMGGSVFYNPKAPSEGQLYEGTKVAVRLGKVYEEEVTSDDGTCIYSTYKDIPLQESFGYITVGEISANSIQFTYTSINEAGITDIQSINLKKGESADINGDNIADIKYDSPAAAREGFEKAVYLTFISSEADLNTTMFSVIPEQYNRGVYPSGVMGINPYGNFIVSKYEGETSSRSALKGVTNGDFILDNTAGKYFCVENAGSFKNARAIEDFEIEDTDEVCFENIFPLLYVNIGEDAVDLGDNTSRSATYDAYDAEKTSIEKEFSKYQKSYDFIPAKYKLNKNIGDIYAKVGILGTLKITFTNIESTVSAAACVKAEFNPGSTETEVKKLFEEDMEFLDCNKTFQIGIVPFSIGVDGKFNIDYEKTTAIDWDFCAGYIGIIGVSVKVGANYGIKNFKAYFNPYANSNYFMRQAYFCGVKSGGAWTPTETVDIKITPKLEMTPKIGLMDNTVWVGLGLIDQVLINRITVKQLITRETLSDKTTVYNKFGMTLKTGLKFNGKKSSIQLMNLTPDAEFKKIASWDNIF